MSSSTAQLANYLIPFLGKALADEESVTVSKKKLVSHTVTSLVPPAIIFSVLSKEELNKLDPTIRIIIVAVSIFSYILLLTIVELWWSSRKLDQIALDECLKNATPRAKTINRVVNSKLVRKLILSIEEGDDTLNKTTDKGESFLELCTDEKNLELLLRNGADPLYRKADIPSPLEKAIASSNEYRAEIYLDISLPVIYEEDKEKILITVKSATMLRTLCSNYQWKPTKNIFINWLDKPDQPLNCFKEILYQGLKPSEVIPEVERRMKRLNQNKLEPSADATAIAQWNLSRKKYVKMQKVLHILNEFKDNLSRNLDENLNSTL